ncbi:MAG: TIGR00730 family Rossman fold protein [Rickettsiales bacterium]|nr:TIGR00730 family Rossman fold protein [Rickettsiales bacterium]
MTESRLRKSLCVFCGAQNAVPAAHLQIGTDLGRDMAQRDIALVYGGGDCGIMGAVANSVLKEGGWVTGVFPRHLQNLEVEHKSLNEIIIVETMHERKKIMYDRADAFAILPGGCGTLDEMFEIITWRQLRLHEKPVIIFNHLGYWDHLVALLDHMINSGFARPETRTMYEVVTTLDELLARVEGATAYA